MLKNIAVRGKRDIVAVFARIADISGKQNTARKQITLDIIDYIASLPLNEDTKSILKAASKIRIDESGVEDSSVPPSIKIPIDIEEEKWNNAMDVFKYVFNLRGNPQMPYFLKVGGNAYIKRIEAQNVELGITDQPSAVKHTSLRYSIDDFQKLSTDDKLVEIYRLLIKRGE